MKNLIARFVRDEQGQDLIEYALLAGFISLAVVTVVTQIGGSLNTLYDKVDQQVIDAGNAGGSSYAMVAGMRRQPRVPATFY